jgi:predicted PurR-regulated permease PerM
MPDDTAEKQLSLRRIAIVALAIIVAVVTLYLLHELFKTLLVIFAGVLLGVLLDDFALRLSKRIPVSRGVAITVIIVLLTAAAVGTVLLAGPRLADQAAQLTTRIPDAVETIKAKLQEHPWGRTVLESTPSLRELLPFGSQELISAPSAFSSVFGALVNLLLILFIGVYLAATPRLYLDNALRLLPVNRRERAREVIVTINRVLQRWLVGRVASMVIVGVMAGLGYWAVGIPLAFTLGLIAAVLSFIPYIGPVLSVIPALLVAFAAEPILALYTLLIYLGVQLLESYVITPLIQRRAVSIPPALLISIQILMGAAFGGLGLFLATPTAVIAIVAIQLLYVEDILGDKVRVLGDH